MDYDPYISTSGSLTITELSSSKREQTEACLVREAVTGFTHGSDFLRRDRTTINRVLFTMPQGQMRVPSVTYSQDVVSGSISVKQRKISDLTVKRDSTGKTIEKLGPYDRGFERFDTSTFVVDVGIDDFFSIDHQDGFLIHVYRSGSGGYVEIDPRIDSIGDVSFEGDVKILCDESLET